MHVEALKSGRMFRQVGGATMLATLVGGLWACSADLSAGSVTTAKFVDPSGDFEQELEFLDSDLEEAADGLGFISDGAIERFLSAPTDEGREAAWAAIEREAQEAHAANREGVEGATTQATKAVKTIKYRTITKLDLDPTMAAGLNDEHTEKSKYYARYWVDAVFIDAHNPETGQAKVTTVALFDYKPSSKENPSEELKKGAALATFVLIEKDGEVANHARAYVPNKVSHLKIVENRSRVTEGQSAEIVKPDDDDSAFTADDLVAYATAALGLEEDALVKSGLGLNLGLNLNGKKLAKVIVGAVLAPIIIAGFAEGAAIVVVPVVLTALGAGGYWLFKKLKNRKGSSRDVERVKQARHKTG